MHVETWVKSGWGIDEERFWLKSPAVRLPLSHDKERLQPMLHAALGGRLQPNHPNVGAGPHNVYLPGNFVQAESNLLSVVCPQFAH